MNLQSQIAEAQEQKNDQVTAALLEVAEAARHHIHKIQRDPKMRDELPYSDTQNLIDALGVLEAVLPK